MSFELVGQHWHATNISFLLWNSSLVRDCMFEVIDEHIRETERSIIAWLCFGDFLFSFFFWDSDSMSDKYSTHYLLFSHRDQLLAVMGAQILTEFTGRWNYKINQKNSAEFNASELSVVQIIGFSSRQHDTCSLLFQFQFCLPQPRFTFLFFCSDSSPLTSLSWLLMVSRVTGLLGLLLLSLTEATCPFLMIGTVASAWPGVWGWGMAWPCPPEEANFEPSVKYCFTCWFWVWWRWNLEFSRWLWTCGRKQKHLCNCSF